MTRQEWDEYRAEFKSFGCEVITYDHMIALSDKRKIAILDEYREDPYVKRFFDDNDRSWAEETELFEELPSSVRVSAVDKAWISWGKQAERIAQASTGKAWKGWRG